MAFKSKQVSDFGENRITLEPKQNCCHSPRAVWGIQGEPTCLEVPLLAEQQDSSTSMGCSAW